MSISTSTTAPRPTPPKVCGDEFVSTIEAARRSGLTYRQVSHWTALGALKPAHGSGGSGNPYRFTEAQVAHLVQIGILCRLFHELELFGPTTEFIKRVWESLETTGQFRWIEGPLVIQLPWPADADARRGA